MRGRAVEPPKHPPSPVRKDPLAHQACGDPSRKGAAGCASGRRRVRWRAPDGKRRPGVIDATRAELVRCLEQRRGSAWFRISRHVAIAGYPVDRALNRVRSLRSDGAESLLALIVALLYMADVRTGFIGKPRPERGLGSGSRCTTLPSWHMAPKLKQTYAARADPSTCW